MREEFVDRAAPLRGELFAHCYRMTGGRADAEDALQDAMVRAWKAYGTLEDRGSLRAWLYKIATNACLDLLASRRARTMPELVAQPGEGEAASEPLWLEPLPQPDAAYANREAVRLAFIVALQALPPRQRAIVILRDVVGLSAEETADALDATVAAVNSGLQRARETLDEHPRAKREPIAGALGELLRKYMTLFEQGDATGLVALVREDAVLSMPPFPMFARGQADIEALLKNMVFAQGAHRLVPCTANGAPAFGIYTGGEFVGITVLDVEGDKIVTLQTFLQIDPAPFGLPQKLADANRALVPGGMLGKYRLEHVLGTGGMGVVWRAHDTNLERGVALKVLRRELAADETARARFLREARAMARLRSPHVITVYEAGEIDGHDVLVMELVEGDTLGRWAMRTRGEADKLQALLAAGRGLAAAHAAGVVHRDFKPDNVLVGTDGRVMVSDFGIARAVGGGGSSVPPDFARGTPGAEYATVVERRAAIHARGAAPTEIAVRPSAPTIDLGALDSPLTEDGTMVGTPAYMSPEQLRGEDVDGRADQFAYCVTVWELLGGARPYGREDFEKIICGDPVTPANGDDLSPRLRAVLERGVAIDPAARWGSMDDLLEAMLVATRRLSAEPHPGT